MAPTPPKCSKPFGTLAAEFFLPPADPKRPIASRRNIEAFDAGLDAAGVQRERMRVPYGSNPLNAIFYPGPPGASARTLLVLFGGFDSTLEKLYFVLVPAAHARGFAVLTYEGPGQGAVLREQTLTFMPEWERPTAAVLDAHFALGGAEHCQMGAQSLWHAHLFDWIERIGLDVVQKDVAVCGVAQTRA